MIFWLLSAAALAIMALIWAALQAIANEGRVLGWALIAFAGMLAMLPQLAGRIVAGAFGPVLLVGSTLLIGAAIACLWRLRARIPIPATITMAALFHVWVVLVLLFAPGFGTVHRFGG